MQQQEIINAILAFISDQEGSAEVFDQLALQIFSYQYKNNLPYQSLCLQKGKTPRTVKKWQDIPAVTINAFKEVTLSCGDPRQAARVFMTSGTTQGVQGKHYHPSLAVYDQSMIHNFKRHFMKDTEKIRMGILFPTAAEMPNSSLAHYLALAVQEFGTPESHYLVDSQGANIDRFMMELAQAEHTGEPYGLLGASFSFVHLLDELARRGKQFSLPKGSRILDTGGFKNRSREIALEEFYHRLEFFLGVPRTACINMYGMTELSTQFYDEGNDILPSVKSGPHWSRTRVVNPLTGAEVPQGERGVLVHCDLANFNSVTTILTEDLGVKVAGGFLLLGRAQGAAAKGCSLAVEEFIESGRGRVK